MAASQGGQELVPEGRGGVRQGEGRPPVQQVSQLAQLHALPADQVENGLPVPSLLSLQDHQHGLVQLGTDPCAMNITAFSQFET